MTPTQSPSTQRGAVTLIAVVLLITVVTFSALVAALYTSSNVSDTLHQDDSIAALFLAESGLEAAVFNLSDSGACDDAGVGADGTQHNLGRGSFQIVSGDDSSAAPLCRITARGTIGLVTRTVEADVGYGVSFSDQFPDMGDWPTQVLTSTEGSVAFDATNCPVATCPDTLAGTGSMLAQTTSGGANDRLTGYRQHTFAAALATGAGLTIDVQVAYQKQSGNDARANNISLELVTTAGAVQEIWSDIETAATAGWVLGTRTVVLPAGQTYDRLRLSFDLHERGGNDVSTWVDEVRFSSGSGLGIVVWRE